MYTIWYFVGEKKICIHRQIIEFDLYLSRVADNRDYVIVLLRDDLDPSSKGYSLIKAYSKRGEFLWDVEPCPPQGMNQQEDYYTSIYIENDKLYATTWSWFRHELDMKTGKIIDSIWMR